MNAIINDQRNEAQQAAIIIGFLVGTDKALSGWGSAPARSRVAVPVVSSEDRAVAKANMRMNGIQRVSFVTDLKGTISRLKDGDHLSIYNNEYSYRWDAKENK